MRIILLLIGLVLAAPVAAQTLPPLTGRVVDQANLLPPAEEQTLTAKLEALERATSRQLVIVTVPNLRGTPIEDFGYKLGETWKIGNKDADNGAILLVAVDERKIRIEVGDGLEPILTDSYSGRIIRQIIRPRFQANDFPGGIAAGADAIIEQLQAPPEEAERRALEASQQEQQEQAASSGGGGSIFPILFWGCILLFVILPMFRSGRRGRRYRRRGRDGVWIWGPGLGSGSSWGGSSGGSSWSGGGGGFSGGGGSFGGGGASGGW